MPELSWRTPIFVAGLVLVAIETFGSVTYLTARDGGMSYLVLAGAACTIISGFLPWIGERAWKDGQRLAGFFSFVILPFSISTILFAAIERSGSAMDHANEAILEQTRKAKLADDALADARTTLLNATVAAAAECSSGRGSRCLSLEARERDARDNVKIARSNEIGLGGRKTKPLVTRPVAMLPVTDEQVTLFEPLVLPATLSMLSVLCLAIGLGRPVRKGAILGMPRAQAESAGVVLLSPAKLGGVALFMAERLMRAEGKQLAAADLFESYRHWCTVKGYTAHERDIFDQKLHAICKNAGIRRSKNLALVNVSLSAIN